MPRQRPTRPPLPEKGIWRGKPSLLLIFLDWDSVFHLLLFWLIVPLFPLLWKLLTLRNTQYLITNHRLRIKAGVFNCHTNEIELFQVVELQMTQPLLYRAFSLGNIHLISRDQTHSHVILTGIPQVESVYEELGAAVLEARRNWLSPWY